MIFDLDDVIKKHEKIVNLSKIYMNDIKDFEHDSNHIQDVIQNIIKIASNLNKYFDIEVCVIAGYWHDVGRTIKNDSHEKISAEILRTEMQKLNYKKEFIDKCYSAIEFHKWNMTPNTIEGLIVKDTDKLAWLGKGRWTACLNNNQKLEEIVKILPKLRNEILYFEESKRIFDDSIVEILELLYTKIYYN